MRLRQIIAVLTLCTWGCAPLATRVSPNEVQAPEQRGIPAPEQKGKESAEKGELGGELEKEYREAFTLYREAIEGAAAKARKDEDTEDEESTFSLLGLPLSHNVFKVLADLPDAKRDEVVTGIAEVAALFRVIGSLQRELSALTKLQLGTEDERVKRRLARDTVQAIRELGVILPASQPNP